MYGKELQMYITTLRGAGCIINLAILIGAAEGIVKKHESNLLATNGGHIEGWAKGFLNRMGFVKGRASTKAKVNPSDFESYKQQFVCPDSNGDGRDPKATCNQLGPYWHTVCPC